MAMKRHHVCVGDQAVEVEASSLWWEKDGYGIPLALVCGDCRAEKMSHYRSDIQERYETDEQIEAEEEVREECNEGEGVFNGGEDDGDYYSDVDNSWEDDCYDPDFDY
jgi:hypothetical protein